MPQIGAPPIAGIRLARIEKASELSELCVRSKAVWGYDETFMALARAARATSRTRSICTSFSLLRSGSAAASAMLLAHAIAEVRRRGARRMTILSNPFAAAFYECNGAIRIGMAPSDAVPSRMLPLLEIRLDPTW